MRLLAPALFGLFFSILAASALFLLSAAAMAQGAADLSACLAIDEDAARLDCYDGLAAMAADEAARADPGGWVLDAWPSRLNPAWTDYEAWTAAINPVAGAGGVPVYPVLAVRCEQGETRALFSFGRALAGETVQVYSRLDAGEVQAGELTLAPDGRRLGLWDSGESARFVAALLGAERLRLQIPVAGGEPLTAAFELAGLAAVAGPLKEACAWE
ncbi:MAG: hypothetical protein IMF08_16560 [Proteobacteria bacterium]|nr:hypothetical protein [Pseudomonadota bacterium]